MESEKSKAIAYVLIIFAVIALFGVSYVKLNKAAQPEPVHQMTQEERVRTVETATGSKVMTNQNFIQNEQMRTNATREAEKAVTSDQ